MWVMLQRLIVRLISKAIDLLGMNSPILLAAESVLGDAGFICLCSAELASSSQEAEVLWSGRPKFERNGAGNLACPVCGGLYQGATVRREPGRIFSARHAQTQNLCLPLAFIPGHAGACTCKTPEIWHRSSQFKSSLALSRRILFCRTAQVGLRYRHTMPHHTLTWICRFR